MPGTSVSGVGSLIELISPGVPPRLSSLAAQLLMSEHGSLGLILAVVIFFGVKDPPRGQSEPEMADLDQVGVYKLLYDFLTKIY